MRMIGVFGDINITKPVLSIFAPSEDEALSRLCTVLHAWYFTTRGDGELMSAQDRKPLGAYRKLTPADRSVDYRNAFD